LKIKFGQASPAPRRASDGRRGRNPSEAVCGAGEEEGTQVLLSQPLADGGRAARAPLRDCRGY
jgi:hypothetical protein